ncbi:MAG TPA: hypothetical protein VK973_04905, partial [Arenicellales bacterium]|nr:hypothetical protein [Arenicellales bacterium]
RDRLDFEVAGYEFPEIDDGDYDSNWLMVRLDVDSRVGSWTAIQPCLFTWELVELVEAAGKAAKGMMDRATEVRFMEPNLAFFLQPLDDEKVEMAVEFDAECLPPEWPEDKPCRLLGHVSRQALEDVRSGLQRDLTRYPVRT